MAIASRAAFGAVKRLLPRYSHTSHTIEQVASSLSVIPRCWGIGTRPREEKKGVVGTTRPVRTATVIPRFWAASGVSDVHYWQKKSHLQARPQSASVPGHHFTNLCLDDSCIHPPSCAACEASLVIGTDDGLRSGFKLYLGGAELCMDAEKMEEMGITYILNATRKCPNFFESKFMYMRAPLRDITTSRVGMEMFLLTSEFLTTAKREQKGVLVHCEQGISRSPTLVIAFLMKSEGYSLIDALSVCRQSRKQVSPNIAFMQELSLLEFELFHRSTVDLEKYRDDPFSSAMELRCRNTSERCSESSEEQWCSGEELFEKEASLKKRSSGLPFGSFFQEEEDEFIDGCLHT